jgi:hypothetical protein
MPNRQRKGHDRDAGAYKETDHSEKSSDSNMPGASKTEYPKSGHKGKGIGKLPAAGGGYE